MPQSVEVAVAILTRPDGRVLLAQRPQGRVYSGFWEFPGGKVEPGEPIADALAREVREELGLEVVSAYPWISRLFVYPHANVKLNFFHVTSWRGELQSLEGQLFSWEDPAEVRVAPMLPANGPVLKALQLPGEYAITQATGLGVDRFLQRLESRLAGGLRLIQIREKEFGSNDLEWFAEKVVGLARPFGARVLINADIGLAQRVGADGVHLNARQLAGLPERPNLAWCGASCHSADELRIAERLGVDFAVLGPVRVTPTHPDTKSLGWLGFQMAIADSAIPVFAIGGMTPGDMDFARMHGAHGVAMLRASWQG